MNTVTIRIHRILSTPLTVPDDFAPQPREQEHTP